VADDPNAPKPSLVDQLATIAGKVEMFVPVGSEYIRIASVGLHALASFLKSQGQDEAALAALHAEYQRRIALAEDPNA
jgi:hypothetical protein